METTDGNSFELVTVDEDEGFMEEFAKYGADARNVTLWIRERIGMFVFEKRLLAHGGGRWLQAAWFSGQTVVLQDNGTVTMNQETLDLPIVYGFDAMSYRGRLFLLLTMKRSLLLYVLDVAHF
jgi:hypothetical protein